MCRARLACRIPPGTRLRDEVPPDALDDVLGVAMQKSLGVAMEKSAEAWDKFTGMLNEWLSTKLWPLGVEQVKQLSGDGIIMTIGVDVTGQPALVSVPLLWANVGHVPDAAKRCAHLRGSD